MVDTQANITCDLLNLYLDDGTAIAEWEATFDGPLIASLREYWSSEVVELSQAGPAVR